MLKFTDQRVAVLIDSENLAGALSEEWNRADYMAVLDTVLQGRKLVRAIAYVSVVEGTNADTFIKALREQNIEVRVFWRRPSGHKHDWDVGIAVDALVIAPRVDVVVVVSGDGDFLYLYRVLQAQGVKVEVASFEKNLSYTVRRAIDDVHLLDESCTFPAMRRKSW